MFYKPQSNLKNDMQEKVWCFYYGLLILWDYTMFFIVDYVTGLKMALKIEQWFGIFIFIFIFFYCFGS